MDGLTIVIETYVKLVKRVDMTLEDIPERYREQVRIALLMEKQNG